MQYLNIKNYIFNDTEYKKLLQSRHYIELKEILEHLKTVKFLERKYFSFVHNQLYRDAC